MDLALTLAALHREVAVHYSLIARSEGLSLQQAELLCSLDPQRSLDTEQQPSFGELATRLGCDKTNITGLVDRLVGRGLVVRRPDPDDRRVARVDLTTEGSDVAGRVRAGFADAVARHCADVTTAEQDQLTALAGAVADALATHRGRDGTSCTRCGITAGSRHRQST